MTHDAAMRLATAGAVLDDLEPDEAERYAQHRRGCLDCRRLERELAGVVADLALLAPPRVPPSTVLPAILAAVRREAPHPVVAAAVPAGRRRRPMVAALAVAAAVAIVVAGLGARDIGRQQELDRASARIASLEAALGSREDAMTVAANPARVVVSLHPEPLAPAADATVVYLPGSPRAWIVASNLPPTPAGHGYQLWFADDAGVHPLQVVSYDGDGALVAPLDVDLAHAAAVMITLEPAGGATGEPGPEVVFGEL